jgi:AcrR family transcriptional regulator
MARGRVQGDHDEKRAKIAEAACRVILRVGLAQASLAEIAREMGYTTGILRHYFADKEQLLLYAKNLLWDHSFERASSAAMRHNGVEKLRAMAISLLPCDGPAVDRFRLLATFNGCAVGNAQLMKVQHRRNAQHWRVFEEVISALQEDGSLPSTLNPRLEACAILAMVDGLADQVIMQPDVWSPDELKEVVIRYIDSITRPPRARNLGSVTSSPPSLAARGDAGRAKSRSQ